MLVHEHRLSVEPVVSCRSVIVRKNRGGELVSKTPGADHLGIAPVRDLGPQH